MSLKVSTPHPIDILVEAPRPILVEVKTVGPRHAGHAVREAVGQLLEYQYFLELPDSDLCILLDREPTAEIVAYIEQHLGMLVLWLGGGSIRGGEQTAAHLAGLGVRLLG